MQQIANVQVSACTTCTTVHHDIAVHGAKLHRLHHHPLGVVQWCTARGEFSGSMRKVLRTQKLEALEW